ncbi:MAG: metallophosphoesterase [Patescibacteria group bacterium]
MRYAFLLIFIALLFAVHWAVYCFLSQALKIVERKSEIILLIVMLTLSFSFIIFALLTRIWESKITTFLYFSSGLWYGLLINLLLSAGVYWIIILLFKFFKVDQDMALIGQIAIILAIIYTGLGVYNAFFPVVKNITVEIKDLPTEWQGKTIVQLSDLHLGRVLGKGFLNRVVNKVNTLNPEAVVITGDLFDGMDGNIASFTGLLDSLKARQGTYYVTGNHDIYIGFEEVMETLNKTKINVLKDKTVNVNGLQIIGVSWPDFNENKDIKKIILSDENFSLDEPSILLYHSPANIFSIIKGKSQWHNSIYFTPDVDFKIAKELGIDLQLSGHTHKGQVFPFGFITKLIYGGYDYGLNKKNGFTIYTTSGTGVWGPTMRTEGRSEIVAITLRNK